MAVDRTEFTEKVDTGIKASKDYKRFYLSFKKEGRLKQKVLDFSSRSWDKKTRISKAKIELEQLKNKVAEAGINFDDTSTLNHLAKTYFEKARMDTKWTQELKDIYSLYCENGIGKKKLCDIRKVHIDDLRKSMEKKGRSKQTENGCSPRTIKKVLVQLLRPILQYAVDNRVVDFIPKIDIPKVKRKKKRVTDAKDKLQALYISIKELYEDDPFYRSLFFFALHGRRWNEIATLQWSDIDFKSNSYTIRAENSKIREDQSYSLPSFLIDSLAKLQYNKHNLVFESPLTGAKLYPPKRQLQRLKEKANIPELTMHYFRHIIVSAMGEIGTEQTILSAALGHTNLATVSDYYQSASHRSASEKTNIAVEGLLGSNPSLKMGQP